MRWLHCPHGGKPGLLFAFAVLLGLAFGPECVRAAEEQKNLQLEVIINNSPINIIGSFMLLPDGRLGASQSELEELGLHVGPRRSSAEVVMLDAIPSLKYQYIERTQKIVITVDDAYRRGQTFDLRTDKANLVRPQAGWGAVLNYDLLGTKDNLRDTRILSSTGASLTLNGRAFSPYGTLEQSAIVTSAPDQTTQVIRLDSAFRYSDPERMITYRAGDAITGGLAWSRPIRIGGLQAQSNFALRPDLVTMPLPTLGGTAAVPSTVDVYVNNMRMFSQEVAAGPFSLSNVPLISGAGNAQLVVRDSSGAQTRTSIPFYASASLLAPDLMSWSLEAGFPRLSYGASTDSYVETPVASGTLRRGFFDWMTAETHLEGGSGIANGGLGVIFKTGTVGVASVAASASSSSTGNGFQAYLSYEANVFGLNINASAQRAFGTYDDLASATARLQAATLDPVPSSYSLFGYLPSFNLALKSLPAIYLDARPPRELDRITMGLPLPFDIRASLNVSLVHTKDYSGNVSNIVSGSYTRSLPYNATFFATVFRDFGTNRNTGFFAGLTFPLRDSVSVTASASGGQGGTMASAEAMKPLNPTPNSLGWRVRDTEGSAPYREASVSYRASLATVEVGARQDQNESQGSLEIRGSIVAMGGGVFFSNWIDDAFAVVDAGAPGIEVSHDNRSAGVSDSRGLLLVPTLRSYQKNKITIDPSNLPVDAEIETTREVVAPADRAGVLVKFAVRSDATAALVVFVGRDGNFVPAGAAGRLENGNEFVVGYDGQAFIKGLASANKATIQYLGDTCRAAFDFVPRPGEQVRLAPVRCE